MVDICKSETVRGLAVKIELQNALGEWIALAKQRDGTLNRSAETLDTSSKEDFGWTSMESGMKSWSIDGGGMYVENNDAYDMLVTLFDTGGCVRVRVKFPSGRVEVGQAIITDFPLEFGFQDAVTYSITLQGQGPLEHDQVAPEVLPTAITITPATPTVAVAANVSLTAAVVPSGASQGVTWTSLTPALATVDATGKVTGVAAGTATIIARSAVNSSISKTVDVTVTAP